MTDPLPGSPPRRVTVSGTGSVAVPADRLVAHLRLSASGETPGAALAEVGRLERAVLALLDELGLDRSSYSTEGLHVGERHDHRQGRVVGHQADERLRVELGPLPDSAASLDRLVAIGPGVGLDHVAPVAAPGTDDVSAARRAAVAAAHAAAVELAEAAGERLGALLHLHEGGGPVDPRPLAVGKGLMAAEAAGPTMPPGEGTVTVTVTATYALLD